MVIRRFFRIGDDRQHPNESLKIFPPPGPVSCGCALHTMPKFGNGNGRNRKSIVRSRRSNRLGGRSLCSCLGTECGVRFCPPRSPFVRALNHTPVADRSRSIEPPRKVKVVLKVRLGRRLRGIEHNQRNIQLIHGTMAAIVVGQCIHCLLLLPENCVFVAEHA